MPGKSRKEKRAVERAEKKVQRKEKKGVSSRLEYLLASCKSDEERLGKLLEGNVEGVYDDAIYKLFKNSSDKSSLLAVVFVEKNEAGIIPFIELGREEDYQSIIAALVESLKDYKKFKLYYVNFHTAIAKIYSGDDKNKFKAIVRLESALLKYSLEENIKDYFEDKNLYGMDEEGFVTHISLMIRILIEENYLVLPYDILHKFSKSIADRQEVYKELSSYHAERRVVIKYLLDISILAEKSDKNPLFEKDCLEEGKENCLMNYVNLSVRLHDVTSINFITDFIFKNTEDKQEIRDSYFTTIFLTSAQRPEVFFANISYILKKSSDDVKKTYIRLIFEFLTKTNKGKAMINCLDAFLSSFSGDFEWQKTIYDIMLQEYLKEIEGLSDSLPDKICNALGFVSHKSFSTEQREELIITYILTNENIGELLAKDLNKLVSSRGVLFSLTKKKELFLELFYKLKVVEQNKLLELLVQEVGDSVENLIVLINDNEKLSKAQKSKIFEIFFTENNEEINFEQFTFFYTGFIAGDRVKALDLFKKITIQDRFSSLEGMIDNGWQEGLLTHLINNLSLSAVQKTSLKNKLLLRENTEVTKDNYFTLSDALSEDRKSEGRAVFFARLPDSDREVIIKELIEGEGKEQSLLDVKGFITKEDLLNYIDGKKENLENLIAKKLLNEGELGFYIESFDNGVLLVSLLQSYHYILPQILKHPSKVESFLTEVEKRDLENKDNIYLEVFKCAFENESVLTELIKVIKSNSIVISSEIYNYIYSVSIDETGGFKGRESFVFLDTLIKVKKDFLHKVIELSLEQDNLKTITTLISLYDIDSSILDSIEGKLNSLQTKLSKPDEASVRGSNVEELQASYQAIFLEMPNTKEYKQFIDFYSKLKTGDEGLKKRISKKLEDSQSSLLLPNLTLSIMPQSTLMAYQSNCQAQLNVYYQDFLSLSRQLTEATTKLAASQQIIISLQTEVVELKQLQTEQEEQQVKEEGAKQERIAKAREKRQATEGLIKKAEAAGIEIPEVLCETRSPLSTKRKRTVSTKPLQKKGEDSQQKQIESLTKQIVELLKTVQELTSKLSQLEEPNFRVEGAESVSGVEQGEKRTALQ